MEGVGRMLTGKKESLRIVGFRMKARLLRINNRQG
jgi:hypothetical protein